MCVAAVALAACTGGIGTNDTATGVTPIQFTVGGTVTGLTGSGLILQNNGGDNLAVTAGGTFTFATLLIPGDSYSVSVLTQPGAPNQTCVVTNASGTIANADVTSIGVACTDKITTTDTIGGLTQGLLGSGLVLQNNGGDNLIVAANGAFTFATPLPAGAAYAVSVLSPPVNPYQDCVIANGAGTTGGTNVTNIAVSCTTNANPAYTIGGTVSGVTGAGTVVLQDNGRDNLTLSADGPFQFATAIPSGSTYNVTALTVSGQQSQTCALTNGSGTVAASNVTNVSVVCKANALISVTVSGLTGSGLAGSRVVLQDNGADDLTVAQNGAAKFATAVASGSAYKVTVLTQPSNPIQNCVVSNGTGTVIAGQTTAITVACTTVGFTVGGTVTGLVGTGLALQNNQTDTLPVTQNGPFVFATPLQSGATFNVTVLTQPSLPYQTCQVNGGAATITNSNINSVTVTCTTNTYSVGGTVTGVLPDPASGLFPTGLAVADNAGAAYPITADGGFTIPGAVASGATYNVTISGQPAGYACAVASGVGTIVNAAVTDVAVSCSQIGGYLYVTNGGGNNISGFAIDINSGALQPLTQIVAPAGQPNAIVAATGTQPASVASGCFLGFDQVAGDYPESIYVANSGSGTVGAYSVNTNTDTGTGGGTLTLISNPAAAAGTAPDYVDFSTQSCAAFALNSGSSNISGFTADLTSGALTAATGSPFATATAGSAPAAAANVTFGIGSAPSQTYEYVASQVANNVSEYTVTGGALALFGSVAAGTKPSAVVGQAIATNYQGADIEFPYVYVANQGSNTISVYQGIPLSGAIAAYGSPVATGNGPTSMVIINETLLYVANGDDNTVSAYSIDTAPLSGTTGMPTPLGITVATGTHPVAVTVADVIGELYLYVVNSQSNDVYVYLVTDTATGALTLVGKYAVGIAPTSVAVPFSNAGG
jgi:6-phosphogluconolactonase (cycloisomerase 2 family)